MAEDMDVLEELAGDTEVPTRQKLLEMLENANVTDEMRDKLRGMLTGSAPQVFGAGYGAWLAVLFAAIIFSIILFFGYKLYKSIKDKEIKREEKKKAKQLKKKK